MKDSITPRQMVRFLNDALKRDAKAISALFLAQVDCNKELEKTRIFTLPGKTLDAPRRIRLIGLLNGMLATNHTDPGAIVMLVDFREKKVLKFKQLSKKDMKKGHGQRWSAAATYTYDSRKKAVTSCEFSLAI